jgi:2-polyprenyl-3-methyl-5-hydroxy-6-metoxy-1,4-benzoquinol methylase
MTQSTEPQRLHAQNSPDVHTDEVSRHERFQFGDNWRRFLSVLNEERLAEARTSLCEMLGVDSLRGMRFLDCGSGSGLFSLAALQLGASRVHSFDFDPESVGCTQELRRRFARQDDSWTIEHGSVLDRPYMESLGSFDIVYSWGVLHHTGNMELALENAAIPVSPGGRLFVSIYNDQGVRSRMWHAVKHVYNRLPSPLRRPYVLVAMAPRELMSAAVYTLRLRPQDYLKTWSQYRRARGMSRWHDMVDWVGGLPFEVAKPETIFDFYRDRGFVLNRLRTCAGGLGCNQFVFSRHTSEV